jgi:phosphoribosylanthranilate isomerase
MKRIIVQIYEIQEPAEAEAVISLGADHVGSVLVSESDWKSKKIKETVRTVRENGAVHTLIPLFNDPGSIFKTLDYYQPDIVHFCESLVEKNGQGFYVGDQSQIDRLVELQAATKEKFPEIKTMRSVPIAPAEFADMVDSLSLAKPFEPVSDFFLTDTILVSRKTGPSEDQPETGFVGITGITCDWDVARRLVEQSSIPVILAGGVSPENVRESILQVRPAGIDSCTRTNAIDNTGKPIRFRKDLEKVRRMIESARTAEAELQGP